MKVIYKVPTLKEYIAERCQILKDMCIWRRLSDEEKARFKSSTSEIQVDNLMASFRHKYL